MRVLLMGNPNVGKSAVFSRLTGTQVITSNYPGTTVEFTRGSTKLGTDKRADVIDVPGTYSLEPTCKAEEVAVSMLEGGDVVVNVIDATHLERNLHLTLQLLEKRVPLVIALNFWDEARHEGISIDVKKLEKLLGVPVVPTVALTGMGMDVLVDRLAEARVPRVSARTPDERWAEVGRISREVQAITHRHHSLRDTLEDASMRPAAGILMAVVVLLMSFSVIRFIGEGLIHHVFDPLFESLARPIVEALGNVLGPSGLVHDVLIGHLVGGRVDFVESLGLLTTGLYVPIAMVLPYVLAFYLVLSVLEDVGYLPRLAVLLDNVMHVLGMHGYAVVPMLLGLGCNVPAVLATRVLESRREKFIAATLVSIGVPCMAQSAMIVGLVGRHGGHYLAYIYGTLFVMWLVIGLVLNSVLPGSSPPLLIEIPPYRLPSLAVLVGKIQMRMRAFLADAVPYVLLGVLVVNLLHASGLMALASRLVAPVLGGVLGLPADATVALLMGFLRKDVAVGMLGPLGLTASQLVVASVVLAAYFPCAATFVVLLRELGPIDMLKATAVMTAAALGAGSALNLVLTRTISGAWVAGAVVLLVIVARILGRRGLGAARSLHTQVHSP